MEILEYGINLLNNEQKNIFYKMKTRYNCGVNLPMGFGKTILSLIIGLYNFNETGRPFIVICSKTLISSWIFEINKFFGDKLKYIVLSNSLKKKEIDISNIHLIITTSQFVGKYYKEYSLETILTTNEFNGIINYQIYNYISAPILETDISYNEKNNSIRNILFATTYSVIIIDEIQNFTNVTTDKCRGLLCIYAEKRYGMSGTIFNEPKIERILGYNLLINNLDFPRSIPESYSLIKSKEYKGYNDTLITYNGDNYIEIPDIEIKIISNKLTYEEKCIYKSIRIVVNNIINRINEFKKRNLTEDVKKYNCYLMTVLVYLRQCIITPLIPLANIAIDINDFNNKSELSILLNEELNNNNLQEYLSDEMSLVSSRFKSIFDIINNIEGKIVLFTCFRTTINLLEYHNNYILGIKVFTLHGNDTLEQRNRVINDFNSYKDKCIFMLSYTLGAEGLNLQTANNVLITDYWWNCGTIEQAIARVVRRGNLHKRVNIFYFTSDTGVEKAILYKQKSKLNIINELREGQVKTQQKPIKIKDIINMININENNELLEYIYNSNSFTEQKAYKNTQQTLDLMCGCYVLQGVLINSYILYKCCPNCKNKLSREDIDLVNVLINTTQNTLK